MIKEETKQTVEEAARENILFNHRTVDSFNPHTHEGCDYLSHFFILTFIKEECKTLQVTSEILSCNSLSYQQFGIDINKGIITHITKY